MPRRFVEKDHPRWPQGSGDKSGEFRDKTPDWAGRISDALPAAGGGSVATGQTTQCPVCGRPVKVVGNGKRSTHNKSKGVRCSGSGGLVDGPTSTLREMRAKKPPRSKKIQAPPPPPALPPARLTESVYAPRFHQAAAEARMNAWRVDSQGVATRSDYNSIRQRVIDGLRAQIRDHEQGEQFYGREQHFKNIAADEMKTYNRERGDDEPYLDPFKTFDRIKWGWDERIREIEQEYDAERLRLEAELARVLAGGPSDSLSVADLELPDQSVVYAVPATDFDPARPLAVYGGMLHFDNSWLSYVALDSLEQRVPPAYHEQVSRYLAEMGGGIWLGTASLPDQDSLGHLRGEQPRGWHKGKTWDDVDGVVSNNHTMAVSHTPNTGTSRFKAEQRRQQVGLPTDSLYDYTATLHEFGHLADYALGQRIARNGDRDVYYERASEQRRWRMLHNEVLRDAGPGLNPYFKQKRKTASYHPGAEEFWADAFGTYMTYDPVPVPGATRGLGVTQRTTALAREYDIPWDTARKLEAYFDQHAKDVAAGRRAARTYRRRG